MGAWFLAFVVTQVVEVPIWMRAFGGRPWIAFAASALTHPIVWFVLPQLGLSHWIYVGVAEGYAVIVEAVWAGRFGVKRPLAWSVLANGLSFGIGMLLRHTVGWP